MTSRKRERPEFKPQDLPGELPILPLRNSVFFPGAVMPLTIGRAKTIRLIEEATRENSLLGIVTQRAPEIDDPSQDDLYEIGTAARIIKGPQAPRPRFRPVRALGFDDPDKPESLEIIDTILAYNRGRWGGR